MLLGKGGSFLFSVGLERDELLAELADSRVGVSVGIELLAPTAPVCVEVDHDQLLGAGGLLEGLGLVLGPGDAFGAEGESGGREQGGANEQFKLHMGFLRPLFKGR